MSLPNDDELTGKFEFSELGRNKAKFTAELKGEDSLWDALKPHLMSNDIGYEYDPETKEGEITVGGFRTVGKFRRVA